MGLHAGTYGFTYESSKEEYGEKIKDSPAEKQEK